MLPDDAASVLTPRERDVLTLVVQAWATGAPGLGDWLYNFALIVLVHDRTGPADETRRWRICWRRCRVARKGQAHTSPVRTAQAAAAAREEKLSLRRMLARCR